MSRPRIPRAQIQKVPSHPETPKCSSYIAFPSSLRSKSPSKRNAPMILYGPHGKTFAQRKFLPTPQGQVGFLERPLTDDDSEVPNTHSNGAEEPLFEAPDPPLPPTTPHRDKRIRQAQNWENVALPRLLAPYLKYLRESVSLAHEPPVPPVACVCMGSGARTLEIWVLYFNKVQKINLQICECRPCAVQLIEQGLFGCAPFLPTLAVDLRVLDFVTRLFVRIAPNVTAFCGAIEDFLKSQGYHMNGKDPLRRRFSNCLRWYNVLQHRANSQICSVLTSTRTTIQAELLAQPPSTLAGSEFSLDDLFDSSDDQSTGDKDLSRIHAEFDDNEDSESGAITKRQCTIAPDPPPLSRPSEYLRERCPVCFGGKTKFKDGVLVCLDACFTQKHNHQTRDPFYEHPHTSFIPTDQVEVWKNRVESMQSPAAAPATSQADLDDTVEDGLKVPASVLNACHDSFTAADGDRQKASTRFFDSTALMALMCCHDRVLWLVDMNTPGECQYFALVLIDTLFKHLPPDWTVGLLYDIACQLERSCVKWQFLPEYFPRLGFAISVFHAFGHGWACQCVYHPRKCLGFGLADGEGCERFWHLLSGLIAFLRVCGYYTRLHTLDSQIQYIHSASLRDIFLFLVRKCKQASTRWEEGDKDVRYSMRSPEFLRQQWHAQVEASTKPLPRQSPTAGKKAIQAAIQTQKARDIVAESVKRLEEITANPSAQPYDIANAELELPSALLKLRKIGEDLRAKETKLGVDGMREYRHLASSPFVRDRMNARALKTRICQRLRARKFERDRLERSFRRQINKRKLHNHTESTVKRRDPGIESLVKKYNKLCKSMSERVTSGRAPPNAKVPKEIEMKELFTLDVDDSIWDDNGLDDNDDVVNPPLWLADEQVRTGIRGILLRDRADESLSRLRYEIHQLAEWYAEEWVVVSRAISEIKEPDLLYQMHLKQQELGQLLVGWRESFTQLPREIVPCFMGPSEQELEAWNAEGGLDIGGTEDDNDYQEITDVGLDVALVEHIDTLDITDSYHVYVQE
ncbi:hypothetical protein DFJ43DRAFT_1006930 [Lentinula guzmanii]|uniref:CxC1-like cysteine cluster associated with KDZ transposases domain-containing protein n=1 Tax=Lentinula guzmanii TaxID=2804957 RepID=A0AA38J3C7_9AGAR|nr:hypothetical protein DFJ43DRAFT_1006930 [Lentinula guzmanii]